MVVAVLDNELDAVVVKLLESELDAVMDADDVGELVAVDVYVDEGHTTCHGGGWGCGQCACRVVFGFHTVSACVKHLAGSAGQCL